MGTIERALQLAHDQGRWSFSFDVPQGTVLSPVQSLDMLYTTMDAHYARIWTINLSAMRYHGGPVAAIPAGSGGTLDNVVDLSPGYKALVTWGVDGSMDTATIDYPLGGCTICVQASTVKVGIISINSPGSANTPTLSGFLAPAPSVQTTVTAPQLSTGVQTIPATGAFSFAVPHRAASFRLVKQSATLLTPGVLQILEERADLATVTKDDGTWPGANDLTAQNQAGYYPLHPLSEYVTIFNSSVAPVNFIGLTFQLDMG